MVAQVQDGSARPHPSADDEGDISVFSDDDQTLVMLNGQIDLRCTDDLEHAGRFSIDIARKTVMDVTRVTMIDSVGISFVIRLAAAMRSAGNVLFLRGPNARVAELITILGADHLVRWVLPDDTDVPSFPVF